MSAGGSQYEVLARLKADGRVRVVKYKSRRTGLTVTVAQVDGYVFKSKAEEEVVISLNSVFYSFKFSFILL